MLVIGWHVVSGRVVFNQYSLLFPKSLLSWVVETILSWVVETILSWLVGLIVVFNQYSLLFPNQYLVGVVETILSWLVGLYQSSLNISGRDVSYSWHHIR